MQEQQLTNNQDYSLWIGLDSYKESNSGIFFGRDEEIRQLSGDIFNNIQTVIYGPSGTGKTSIIRAGIFKIARANRYLPVYVRLNHNTDSKTYTQQIIDAIQDEAEKYNIDIDNTSPYIVDNTCLSLWEYFHCNEFWNEENYPVIPLIVVDQFEEIFTLGKNLSLQPDFFNQLSDLCDNKYPQYVIDYLNDRNNERIEYPETINYRFVISLREDFLARLEEQAETIPALKRNRFSLQCINEEQALDIILKPQPGLVSEDVAALIIEKVTNKKYNKDFKFHDEPEILVEPAILSLFCRELDKKRREKDLPTLSPELIGEFGDNIIRDFYLNSLSSLSEGNEENHSPLPTRDEKIDYLESRLITVDGFRDAVAYQNAKAFGFTKKDIKTLIDNRLVRIDEWDGTRRIEFIHDVLCKVANKHRKERAQEKANKKKEEEAKRLLEEEKAKREQIEREAEEKQRKLKEEAKRIQRKNRRRLAVIGIAATFIGLLVLGWWYLWEKDYKEYYGNFTTLNGWPVGLGDELNNKDDKERLIVHYRLTRKGMLSRGSNPFYMVEILDANDKPCTNKFYETPIVGLLEKELDDEKAAAFAELQQKTAYWIYSPGDIDYKEVARCTAYGLDNKELYSIQYYKDKTFASADESKYVQWAVFNDVNGKQMMVTDNGADRIRQTIKNGLVTGCLFFTELGTPQKNVYDAYGYQYEVDSVTRQIQKQYCVDKFGAKIDSTLIEYYHYEQGRVLETSLYEVEYPQQGMIVYQFKNFSDTLLFNNNGTLGYGTFHTSGGKYSKIVFKYDKENRPLLNQKYVNENFIESKAYTYLPHTSKIDSILVLQDGVRFTERYSYPNDSTTEIAFWKNGTEYSQWKTNEYGDSLFYHKSTTTNSLDSLRVRVEYLDKYNHPISHNECMYSSYSKIKDVNNKKNVKLEYFYDAAGNICKSEWFDYDEYGNRIARAVAGIEGTPVRCPNWDWNGLSYYKMLFLFPFNRSNARNNIYASIEARNEFGDKSIIQGDTWQGLVEVSINELPHSYNNYMSIFNISDKSITNGIKLSMTKTALLESSTTSALYLHILSKEGTVYKAGLRDGYILIKIGNTNCYPFEGKLDTINQLMSLGGSVVVARPNIISNKYDVITIGLDKGNTCSELHIVKLTNEERVRL